MNRIEKINQNYTPLNNWLRMMCVKQPRFLDGGCKTNYGYERECKECRFRNLFNLSGEWD